jgi:hypothetical protein
MSQHVGTAASFLVSVRILDAADGSCQRFTMRQFRPRVKRATSATA